MITDWDELGGSRHEQGHIAGVWSVLRGSDSVTVELSRIRIDPARGRRPCNVWGTDEETLCVLEGQGTLLLRPSPRAGGEVEEHADRAGSTVARPTGTGMAHAFRAADAGLTLLADGARDPNDLCFCPRSGQVFVRVLGLVSRLECLDYRHSED